MPVGIKNATATSEKKQEKNGLHKGNTGSQTLDQGLLPKWVDSYVHACIRIHLKLVQIIIVIF